MSIEEQTIEPIEPAHSEETAPTDPILTLLEEDNFTDANPEDAEAEPTETDPRTGTDTKRLDIEADLISDGLELIEGWNVALCLSVSGDNTPDKYKNSDEKRKAFADKLSAYFKTEKVTITPAQNILLAAVFFFGFPIFRAFAERMKKAREQKIEAVRAAMQEAEDERRAAAETRGEKPQIKEVIEKRKSFAVHANGFYKHPADSTTTYIPAEKAIEAPSAEVVELIQQGLKNHEIRKILGY